MRPRILGYGSALALVVAGGVCAILVRGGTGQVLALVLIGLGFVLATSLVFLEVGLSEDRERAREQRQLRQRSLRRRPARTARHQLERMRGRPRRLK